MRLEGFIGQQRREQREMKQYERAAAIQEAETHAKWWGMLEEHGKAIRGAYDAELRAAGGDPADPAALRAQAAGQKAYEERREALDGVAGALGFELPEFFSTEEFRPEYFAQFAAARQAAEQKVMMLQLPTGEREAVVGTPAELAAAARARGGELYEPGKGAPKAEDAVRGAKLEWHTDATGQAYVFNPDTGASEPVGRPGETMHQVGDALVGVSTDANGVSTTRVVWEQPKKADGPSPSEYLSFTKSYDTASSEFRTGYSWLRKADSAQDNSTGDAALAVAFIRSQFGAGTISDSDMAAAQSGSMTERVKSVLASVFGDATMSDSKRRNIRRQIAINLKQDVTLQRTLEQRTLRQAKALGYQTDNLFTPYADEAEQYADATLAKLGAPEKDRKSPAAGEAAAAPPPAPKAGAAVDWTTYRDHDFDAVDIGTLDAAQLKAYVAEQRRRESGDRRGGRR